MEQAWLMSMLTAVAERQRCFQISWLTTTSADATRAVNSQRET